MTSPLAGLHDVIEKWIRDFLEPVRNAGRHDDDVAPSELVSLAAVDSFAPELIGRGRFHVYCIASGDERRGAFENVDDVGILRMDLSHARLLAAAGVNHIRF